MDSELLKLHFKEILVAFPDSYDFNENEQAFSFKRKETVSPHIQYFWSAFFDLGIDISRHIFSDMKKTVLFSTKTEIVETLVDASGFIFDTRRYKSFGLGGGIFPELVRFDKSIFIKFIIIDNMEGKPIIDENEKVEHYNNLNLPTFSVSDEKEKKAFSFIEGLPNIKPESILSFSGIILNTDRLVSWGISKDEFL